ncbi:hypothetical protein ACFVYP_40350 [Kitasatospora sp. NPDC058201]|uniref:hypothetical protein n=1 Tax=unclassified Kitasatospora TaxID=2633591 RepID=UPI00364CB76D
MTPASNPPQTAQTENALQTVRTQKMPPPEETYLDAVQTLAQAATDFLRSATGLALPTVAAQEQPHHMRTLAVVTAYGSGLVRIDLADLIQCCTLMLDRVPLDRAAQVYRAVWGEDHDHFAGESTLDHAGPGSEFEFEDNNDDAGRRTYDALGVTVLDNDHAQLRLPDLRLQDAVHGLRCLNERPVASRPRPQPRREVATDAYDRADGRRSALDGPIHPYLGLSYASEHLGGALTEAQLREAGITVDRCGGQEPPADPTGAESAVWAALCEQNPVSHDGTRELDPEKRIRLHALDPVPLYDRGRANVPPAPVAARVGIHPTT